MRKWLSPSTFLLLCPPPTAATASLYSLCLLFPSFSAALTDEKKKKKAQPPLFQHRCHSAICWTNPCLIAFLGKKKKKFSIHVKPWMTSVCYILHPFSPQWTCVTVTWMCARVCSEPHTVIQCFNGLILLFFVCFYGIWLHFSNLVIKMLVPKVLKVGRRLLRFYNLPQIQDKHLPSVLPLA